MVARPDGGADRQSEVWKCKQTESDVQRRAKGRSGDMQVSVHFLGTAFFLLKRRKQEERGRSKRTEERRGRETEKPQVDGVFGPML